MRVERVLETCLYVDDLDRAQTFYRDILGLELFSRVDNRHVFFRCGPAMVLLFDPDATLQGEDIPPHGAKGPGHIAFAVAKTSLEGWRLHLARRRVAIEREVHWDEEKISLYLRDPAGNSVELATPEVWAK